MDMRISGSGHIASGEYENIAISGSGRLSGLVRCESFRASGSSHGEELECKNDFKVSGSSSFDQRVKAGSVSVSGSFSCGGDLIADEKISCSGGAKCGGNLKCGELRVSGGLNVKGDVEAEKADISGRLNCGGLLNAEEITIKFNSGMEIGSIGGSKIVIVPDQRSKGKVRLPLLASLVKGAGDNKVYVKNDIEGDVIALEDVTAQRVSGRVIAIGEGCEIELVRYSEELEVAPGAKVGKSEKI